MPKISLHANGIPPGLCRRLEAVKKAAIKAGCSEMQAISIAKLAYAASSGFHWNIVPLAVGLEIWTRPTDRRPKKG